MPRSLSRVKQRIYLLKMHNPYNTMVLVSASSNVSPIDDVRGDAVEDNIKTADIQRTFTIMF